MCKHLHRLYKHEHLNLLNLPTNSIPPTSLPGVVHMNDDKSGSIIVEHDVLRETYVPDQLRARQTQTEQILCCLSPVFKRRKPIHTWLYGKAGTGKTTTAIYALRRLKEKAHVKSLIINCWEKRTFYDILDEMISEFGILSADEHRTSFKLERLRSFFKDRPFVVVLDEVDQIKPWEPSSVLYNLDSVLNAGIVCISDSTRVLMELEERVRSRLNPHAIFFPCYSRQTLLEILANRAELALAKSTWSHTAMRRIAATAQGDARAAIRMLRRAAVLVDHHRLERITTKTLEEVCYSQRWIIFGFAGCHAARVCGFYFRRAGEPQGSHPGHHRYGVYHLSLVRWAGDLS